jgi:hypothetical protein
MTDRSRVGRLRARSARARARATATAAGGKANGEREGSAPRSEQELRSARQAETLEANTPLESRIQGLRTVWRIHRSIRGGERASRKPQDAKEDALR